MNDMRPIDKGESPYEAIHEYQEAEPYLSSRIGRYCSFCELPIFHVPEVEHKEGKKSGGSETKWENLLYGCKYCNTRKAQKIKAGESGKWLWPDQDNTFLAFTYNGGCPELNEVELRCAGKAVYDRAEALFEGVGLGFQPRSVRDKDKRWQKRIETLGQAEKSRQIWLKTRDSELREDELGVITSLARSTGFFSIWMMVFKDDKVIKNALIDAFPGTSRDCFDSEGNPITRRNGSI